MRDFVKFTENGEEKSGVVLISWLDGGSTKMKIKTDAGFSIIYPSQITDINREAGKEMKEAIETAVEYVEKLVEKYKNAEVDNRIEEIKKAEQKSIERIKQELAELRNVENDIIDFVNQYSKTFGIDFSKKFEQTEMFEKLELDKIEVVAEKEKEAVGTEQTEGENMDWERAHSILTSNYEKWGDDNNFKHLSVQFARGERTEAIYREIMKIPNW